MKWCPRCERGNKKPMRHRCGCNREPRCGELLCPPQLRSRRAWRQAQEAEPAEFTGIFGAIAGLVEIFPALMLRLNCRELLRPGTELVTPDARGKLTQFAWGQRPRQT